MRTRNFVVYTAHEPITHAHAHFLKQKIREVTNLPALIVESPDTVNLVRAHGPAGTADRQLAGGAARARRLRDRKNARPATPLPGPTRPAVLDPARWNA